MIPVFGYLFGWLVLRETLAPQRIGASLAIIAGAMALSLDPASMGRGLRIKWRLAGLMTVSSAIFGLHAVVFKFVAAKQDFWGACFWEYAGFVVAGVLLWIFSPASRCSFMQILTPAKRRDFTSIMGLCVFSEVITLVGNLATNLALLMAPVAMVLLVSSTQPVFVFLLGLAATRFFPKFVTEAIGRGALVHKIACLVVICGAGAWMA